MAFPFRFYRVYVWRYYTHVKRRQRQLLWEYRRILVCVYLRDSPRNVIGVLYCFDTVVSSGATKLLLFFFFFESEIPIGFSNLHKTKWYSTHIPLTFLISLCRIISAGSIALANPINANFVFFLFDVCIYAFRPLYEIKYTRATHLQSSDYYRANELIFISHVKDKSVL